MIRLGMKPGAALLALALPAAAGRPAAGPGRRARRGRRRRSPIRAPIRAGSAAGPRAGARHPLGTGATCRTRPPFLLVSPLGKEDTACGSTTSIAARPTRSAAP